MDNTTNKITVNNDAQIADWAKPSYNVLPAPTTPTNQQFSNANQPVNNNTITTDSMKSVGQVKLPTTPPVDTTSAGIIGSTQPSIQQAQEQYKQVQKATGTQAQDAQQALQSLALDVFGKKSEVQANQVNLENQAGLLEQQKVLGDINTEIANQQAGLRTELDRVRNVPGQTQAQLQASQNAINDTYGLRLANLAIRQSAANANITAIKENADRQTKLLLAPLDNKIQYLSTFGKDNVDFLSKEQQNKLAFITNNLESQKKDIETLQNAKTQMITEIAQNGGGTNTALIKQIQDAKTLSDVTTLGASSGFVGKIDRLYKSAQIANIYSEINDRNIKNNPVTQNAANNGVLDAYNLAKGLLGRDTDTITGIKGITAYIPGSDAQYTINQFNQLKGFLSLENRSKLKGQGAVSDFEGKILERAASALDTNLSNEDFKRELARVTGVLGTASGIAVPVQIKDPKTGQIKAGLADRNTINSATLNGYSVDYSLPNELQ